MKKYLHDIKQFAAKHPGSFANQVYPISDAVLADARRMVQLIHRLSADPYFQQLTLADAPPQVLRNQHTLSLFNSYWR